jgi:hypothetical protein
MNPATPPSGPALEGGFRTEVERVAGARLKEIFERCPDPWEKKMEAFQIGRAHV